MVWIEGDWINERSNAMWLRHGHLGGLVTLFAVALVLRLGAGVWWQSRLADAQSFGFADSHSYWELARTIAEGRPYQFDSPDAKVFRTPGYPAVLAALFWLWGGEPPVWAARAESAVLGTLAVAAVYWLGSVAFDGRVGYLAAWLAALLPGAIGLGVYVLSEAAFAPLLVLNVALWAAAWRAQSMSAALGIALATGLCAAGATLMRPSWLLFSPWAVAVGVAFFPPRGKQLLIGGAILVGLALGMAPWWARNYQVVGRFVPTTLQVGASLYDGLNPAATGASDMRFVPGFVAEERAAGRAPQAGEVDAESTHPPFEYRLDRRMFAAAVEWARSHPLAVARLAAIKFARLWNVWPNEAQFRSWPLRLVVFVTYTPVLFFALVGAWRFRRRCWTTAVCWLPAAYLTLMHMIFVSSLRYREPPLLALLVLAAAACLFRSNESPSPASA
ncbi:MAG: ArnT family glycosyltransferase [Pirellulales bacterium]